MKTVKTILILTLSLLLQIWNLTSICYADCNQLLKILTDFKPIEPFTSKGHAKNYEALLRELENGGIIKFPNKREIRILRKISFGGLTHIFETADGAALRLPKKGGRSFYENSEIMSNYLKEHRGLKNGGVQVVDLAPGGDGILPYGLMMKLEPFIFDGEEFARAAFSSKPSVKYPVEMIEKAKVEFRNFMLSTWKYESIDDFGLRQMGFNGREWKLFDFGGADVFGETMSSQAKTSSSKYILSRTFEDLDLVGYQPQLIPLTLQNEIGLEIVKLRMAAGLGVESSAATKSEFSSPSWIRLKSTIKEEYLTSENPFLQRSFTEAKNNSGIQRESAVEALTNSLRKNVTKINFQKKHPDSGNTQKIVDTILECISKRP